MSYLIEFCISVYDNAVAIGLLIAAIAFVSYLISFVDMGNED